MLNKEYIQKEILRCAEELGRTPSEKVFYEYAEIGIYDLQRCGYSNYGELVRGAKLTPNKFDKTKYTRKQLCNLFTKIMLEKGEWPTKGILAVEHLGNKNFPDPSTFYRVLGLTKDLALKILEYVRDKRGYDDVIKICNSVLAKSKDYTTEAKHSDESGAGYVYLLKSSLKSMVAYKIGKTKDLHLRLRQLRQPSNIEELVHQIKTDDMKGVEQYWLKRFRNKALYPGRPKNEWFKLNASDVKAFKRWRFR